MKLIFALLLISFSLSVCSQEISGIVFDGKTKEPLEGASVYFQGTTLGAITDAQGRFVLETGTKISSPLVISYLGYTDAVRVANWSTAMQIAMVPELESLGEVVILGEKPFTREELMKAFKQQFLGESRAGKRCLIVNEDAIDLWYDVFNKKLVASSKQAIIVENRFLGYQLRIRIIDFSVVYHRLSIQPYDRNQTNYVVTTFFVDHQKGVKNYEKRRQKVFKTSALRLMRTIALEDWDNKDFSYYFKGHRSNPASLFTVSDSIGSKKIQLANRLVIVDDQQKASELIPMKDYFMIDGYGNFFPSTALFFSGRMGNQRAGDLLPLDYNLEYRDE